MKRTITVITLLSIGVFFLSSCQESESDIVRKAKLVGNENIQLKQQLSEKDKEIELLKNEIAQKESEIANMKKEYGQTTINSLKLVVETEKRNKSLMAEIEELKKQLNQ